MSRGCFQLISDRDVHKVDEVSEVGLVREIDDELDEVREVDYDELDEVREVDYDELDEVRKVDYDELDEVRKVDYDKLDVVCDV